ncbi:MAG: hypothetical protein QXS51_03105 [Thermoproteota archaeon]|nr:hypothetical protein [Candidatus Brockarchaeota archaeon]
MIVNCRKIQDKSSLGAVLWRKAKVSHKDTDIVNSRKFLELRVLGLPFKI